MRLIENILVTIAPDTCIGCGEEGVLVCANCIVEKTRPIPSRCVGCLRLTENFRTCQNCRRLLHLRHVWVAHEYRGLIKQALWEYKFNRKRQVAKFLAIQIDHILTQLPAGTLITHVPTATTRVRQRSYDQAKLLARELAYRRRLEYKGLLSRTNQTRQVGSSRAERFAQLRNAFIVIDRDKVNGRQVLLVDDIVTTGASLANAGLALKQAGAASVSAAVVASGH
jgi:ComF family protein